MGTYKPIDVGKEDFRKYLDRQGVLETMTAVLIKCNTERPENALDFLLENLAEKSAPLKAQLQQAQEEIERLKAELRALKSSNGSIKQEPPVSSKSEDEKPTATEQERKIDTPPPSPPLANGVAEEVVTGGEAKENDATATTTAVTAPSTGNDTGNTTTSGTTKDTPGNEVSTAAPAPPGNEALDVKKEPNNTTLPTATETK